MDDRATWLRGSGSNERRRGPRGDGPVRGARRPRRRPAPRQPPRRRPSGAPPPLPHHLHTTGLGWLIVLVATVIATVVIFHDGLRGPAITATVIDDTIVRWISGVDAPGLHKAARMLTAVSSWWMIQILCVGPADRPRSSCAGGGTSSSR